MDQVFADPTRLLVRLADVEDKARPVRLTLTGKDAAGKRLVEKFSTADFRWGHDFGTATSRELFTHIDRLGAQGLSAATRLTLSSVDLSTHDISLFAPLYAEHPDIGRAQKMIDRKLHNPKQYWRPFGLPAFLSKDKRLSQAAAVWRPWISMAARGMLAYGRRGLAAELFEMLMKGVIKTVKEKGEFRQFHHADTGESFGGSNHLAALAPIGLFMEILGVKIHSPWKIQLDGFNPYPWTVRLKYRGLHIEREQRETRITFPDGRSITVNDPTPSVIDGRAEQEDLKKKEP